MSSSNAPGRLAAGLGLLAVLPIPMALAGSRFVAGVRLLESLYIAVPVACVLGLAAVAAARRARLNADRSVHPDAVRPRRLVRGIAFFGLYLGLTGALALAVYGVLRWAE